MIELVLWDRDGTLVQEMCPPQHRPCTYTVNPFDLFPAPSAFQAVEMLAKNGLKQAVITNQSWMGTGHYGRYWLGLMNDRLNEIFNYRFETIIYCPHRSSDNCDCRKPRPGMILKASECFDIPVGNIVVVGNRASDMIAAQNAEAIAIILTWQSDCDGLREDIIKAIASATYYCRLPYQAAELILRIAGRL